MKIATLSFAMASLLLAGCSGSSGLSTGSIFGAGAKPSEAAAAAPSGSDPTSRAFQVGTVSARAIKCGYNFDAVKLRASFLAAEAGSGATSDELQRVEKVYDVAYNGVTKAVQPQADYCTDARTREIKADLTRHLAGDFQPPASKIVAQQDGFFSGLFDGSTSENKGPSFGSNDWWDKQNDKVGN